MFPLRIGAIRAGVMGLYRDEPGPLTTAQLGDALVFADTATVLEQYLTSQEKKKKKKKKNELQKKKKKKKKCSLLPNCRMMLFASWQAC